MFMHKIYIKLVVITVEDWPRNLVVVGLSPRFFYRHFLGLILHCHVHSHNYFLGFFMFLFIHRTGKRTIMGLLKDGYNSAIRYYYNNFNDGYRQVSAYIIISCITYVG